MAKTIKNELSRRVFFKRAAALGGLTASLPAISAANADSHLGR